MAKLPPIFNMDFGYPGFSIKVELIVLQEYVKRLELGIKEFCDSYIESEMKNYSDAEYYKYQHIYLIAEEEIPRIIRLPLVISIYTMYENSVTQLLSYAKVRENKYEDIKDIKGNSLTSKFNKYLKDILNYEFQFNNELMQKISSLNKVRNCVAHANGNLSSLKSEKINELKVLANTELGIVISLDKIDVTYDFLESSMNDIETNIRALMDYMEYLYGAK